MHVVARFLATALVQQTTNDHGRTHTDFRNAMYSVHIEYDITSIPILSSAKSYACAIFSLQQKQCKHAFTGHSRVVELNNYE